MQEVFSKIIEQLEELKKAEIERDDLCDEEGCGDGEEIYEDGKSQGRFEQVVRIIEIVKQEAEKFGPDTNVGSNGWIPCSSGVMPKEYIKKDGHTDPSEEVLVYIYYGENCVNNGCGVSRYWEHSEFHKNPWIDLKYGKENVVAWQPRPEPYKPKGE